jgi:olefin beta-lactone synthetase
MNIADILLEQAAIRPAAPAIIDRCGGRDRVTTFADLASASARGARLLHRLGLAAGDAVLIFQPMSAELYAALLALFRLGLVAMFIDPSAGRKQIERCLAIHPPRALIATGKAHLLRLVSPGLRRIPCKIAFGRFIPGAADWHQSSALKPFAGLSPCTVDTPALMTFTSGSTGQPKAAVRSHGFLREQHRVLARTLEHQPGTCDLTTLPVFVLANLASGITSLIPGADLRYPGAIDPGPVLAQIDRWHPVTSAASPAFFVRLCDGGADAHRRISGFRRIFTGGAPVFADQLDRFGRYFAGAEIVTVYGSTEAEPIAHISRQALSEADRAAMTAGKGLLVGTPVREIQARVIDAAWGRAIAPMDGTAFDDIALPPGRAGEIVVSGRHVLPGYLNGVGDGETKFRVDGTIWHRTGDSGVWDERGRLWLLGRAGAVIDDARGRLHPFSVECAARCDPRVAVAALLGHNGRRTLLVQSKKNAPIDIPRLSAMLAWADLDEVRQIQRIPLDRRHNAKVDYTRLATEAMKR